MGFQRSKNYVIEDKKLSAVQAFGIAAGLVLASAVISAGITKSVVQDVVEKEVPVIHYRDLPENAKIAYKFENPVDKNKEPFSIIQNNCELSGNLVHYMDHPSETGPIMVKLQEAMNSEDPAKALASLEQETIKNVANMKLKCVTPVSP
jgi:hypothetical protein